MPNNIHLLDVATTNDVPCSRVIEELKDKNFESILVIGFEREFDDIYVASGSSGIGDQLLLMERAKHFLLHEAEAR